MRAPRVLMILQVLLSPFSIAQAAPGSPPAYRVRERAPGDGPAARPPKTTGGVRGRVVRWETGQPVGGAKVRVYAKAAPRGEEVEIASALSGEDGTFALSGLKPGFYSLVVSSQGSAMTLIAGWGYLWALRVRPGQTEDLSDIFVEPGGAVRGRLLGGSSGGQVRALPASSALMRARDQEGFPGEVRPDGSFVVEGLPFGEYTLLAWREDRAPAAVEVRVSPDGRTDGLEIPLEPGATLQGLIQSPEGRPVEGAKVSLRIKGMGTQCQASSLVQSAFRHRTTVSDSQGRFAFPGLVPCYFQLVIQARGFALQSVDVLMNGAALSRTILLEPGASLTGVVVDEGEGPVAGAEVSLPCCAENTLTGEDGAFRFDDLQAGKEVQLRATSGMREASLKLTPGPDRIRVVLPRGGAVRGTVLDQATRQPVVGALVEISGKDTHDHYINLPYYTTRTDGEGRFFLDKARAETFRVIVRSRSHASPLASSPFPIEAGKVTELAPLRLAAGVTLKGLVLDRDGKPLPGALLRVELQEGDTLDADATQQERSGTDGRFSLVLSEGLYKVTAFHPRYGETVGRVQLQGRERPLTVSFRAAPGGSLTGRLLGPEDKPFPSVDVTARRRDDDSRPIQTETDLEGRFAFRGLPPGRYFVLVMPFIVSRRERFLPIRREVMIREGEATHIELSTGGSATLRGRVLLRGRPLPQARIELSQWGEGHDVLVRQAQADREGLYEARGLPPGKWNARVSTGRHTYIMVRLTLPEGKEHSRDIVLPEGGIEGRVLDGAAGRPIGGATVYAKARREDAPAFDPFQDDPGHCRVSTDQEGRFHLDGLSPEAWVVEASAGGYDQAEVEATVGRRGDTTVEIKLRKATRPR